MSHLTSVIVILYFTGFSVLSENVPGSNTPPEIGAFQMDFKYSPVKVLSETPNTKVELPLLKASYYTETTYQLICKSSYPIQWIYTGVGAPRVQTTTSRLASNELEKFANSFEARVIFSFTEASQSGKYSCVMLDNSELNAYFDVRIASESNVIIDYVTNGLSTKKPETQDLLISHQTEQRVVTCCSKSNGFPKLTYLTCDSVSECGIRLSYMENRVCKGRQGRACDVGALKTSKQIENGMSCSKHTIADETGGLVKCSGANARNEYLAFTVSSRDQSLITDFKSTPPTEDILQMFVEPVGSNELFISCVPNWFFFSRGIRWGVQAQGSNKMEYLNDDKTSLRVKKNDFTGETVSCFAPLWNSQDWRNLSTLVA